LAVLITVARLHIVHFGGVKVETWLDLAAGWAGEHA
jgi:hypothetical protein